MKLIYKCGDEENRGGRSSASTDSIRCAEALDNPRAANSSASSPQRTRPTESPAKSIPEIVLPEGAATGSPGPMPCTRGWCSTPARSSQPRLDQIERKGLILLLDQVTDPHNVGAVMRSCAAFGVTPLSPPRGIVRSLGRALQGASGAYEHVPFVKVTNLARAIAELKEYGFFIMGLDSDAETTLEAEKAPLAARPSARRRGQGTAKTHARQLRSPRQARHAGRHQESQCFECRGGRALCVDEGRTALKIASDFAANGRERSP